MSDGSQFYCSDSFVRKFLWKKLGWSERHAMWPAQELPNNHEKVLWAAFLQEAAIICNHSIPAELQVNTDQTQLVYQQGTQTTWNKAGEKQVETKGQDEKRAFTLVPSISASGDLLPFQAVYHGKTALSCPSPKAPGIAEAQKLQFKFEASKTKTYWSTQETMRKLVDEIIAPYFNKKKRELGLPNSQDALWKIDCWSVHKSAEFRTWMKKAHKNIIVLFVPGGCTGIWQPLDVGIQYTLKHSLQHSAHRDLIAEVMAHLDGPESDGWITINTTVANLHDRSVGWMVWAYQELDDKVLIKKVSSWDSVSKRDMLTNQIGLSNVLDWWF